MELGTYVDTTHQNIWLIMTLTLEDYFFYFGLWKRLFLANSEVLNGAPGQFNCAIACYSLLTWVALQFSVESQQCAIFICAYFFRTLSWSSHLHR